MGNEGLRARVAAEMAANTPAHAPGGSASWWVPRLEGQPLLTKPPLQYWMVAALGRWTGTVGPWEARFPSVLAAVVIAGLATWQGYRRLGDTGAWCALLVVPTSLGMLTQVPSAELDMPLAAWVFGGLVALERVVSAPRHQALAWWFFGVCLAGGFLQKWTGPVFLVPVLAFWLALKREWHRLADPTPWLVAFVVLGAGGGWLLLAAREVGWEMLWQTVVQREGLHHLSPAHHGRAYPFGEWVTYPLAVLGMGLPGCLWLAGWWLLPADSRRSLKTDPWVILLGFSVVIGLAFWTVVPGHKARHALPVLPCLSALASMVVGRCFVSCKPHCVKWLRIILVAGSVVWLGVKGGQAGLKWREEGSTRSPSRLASGIAEVLEGKGGRLQVGQLRDDGLFLALADRGIALERRQEGAWVPGVPILATPGEVQAGVAGTRAVLETTDQQGKPVELLDWTGNP